MQVPVLFTFKLPEKIRRFLALDGAFAALLVEQEFLRFRAGVHAVPLGKRRRVARLVLRIRARAVSAERVAPVISVERVSTLFSSGMFTLPARSRAAGVDCRLQHPSQPAFGWLGCWSRQSTPVFG
jgi:hypothetical protein